MRGLRAARWCERELCGEFVAMFLWWQKHRIGV